jgi:aryl-alcohol dehydrogenase-like predicted oxidoreductase
MDYVKLGKSNVKVSPFCLGTMMFGGKTDAPESIAISRAAIDAGVNFFDTADIYAGGATETILGQALQGVRDRVVLASKAGMTVGPGPNDTGISRFHFVRAVEASLRRLRTDRIDVYYIHWPVNDMNLDETLRTLDDLVKQGKILYPAFSNFPAWLATRSQWVAEVGRYAPLVCGQYPYNLIERGIDVEVLPMAKALGVGITIYRPLCVGALTGKYLDAATAGPDQRDITTRSATDERPRRWTDKYRQSLLDLRRYAQAHNRTMTDAANAWIASHPAVTSVIVGVSTLAQLQENLKGFDWKLSPEQRAEIGALFPTDPWEETGNTFPAWRRSYEIVR